jgi:hypothetical protein
MGRLLAAPRGRVPPGRAAAPSPATRTASQRPAAAVPALADELAHVVRTRPGAAGPTEADRAVSGPAAAAPPSAVRAGLELALERHGRGDLWRLLDGQTLTLAPSLPLSKLVPDAPAPVLAPIRAAFGPFGAEDSARALSHAGLGDLLSPRVEQAAAWDLWIVYENDGSGIVPNFGSGSDQGRTAALYVYAKRRAPAVGLSRLGVTPIEMVTPRGSLPSGAAGDPTSTYLTPPGPYSGVVSLDVGVTVHRRGQTTVEVLGSAGVDSQAWGKVVQDTIHTKLSNSPLFPWPTGTKPLAELGVAGHQTIDRLLSGDFRGLTYTGRLEFEQSAVVGTRRTEGGLRARFVVRTAGLRTPLGPLWLEFSPAGGLVRGFIRYNDGRVAALQGLEAGVSSSFMVNLGPVGLGLAGEMLMSTDPAFRTGLPAGAHPAVSPLVGWLESGPAGHHGTGQLILRIDL